MTVRQLPMVMPKFIGLSSDTKPTMDTHPHTCNVGSEFYEYDTGDTYITYDRTSWVIKRDIGYIELKRIRLALEYIGGREVTEDDVT